MNLNQSVIFSKSKMSLAFAATIFANSAQSGVITYSVSSQETSTKAASIINSAFSQNNNTDYAESTTENGFSTSKSDLYGDEKRASYTSGSINSLTTFEFSEELIAQSFSEATVTTNSKEGSLNAVLEGQASAARIDDLIIRTDTRRTTNPDGSLTVTEDIRSSPYSSRAYAFSKTSLRVEAFESGLPSSTASDFILHARFSDDSVIGDSGSNFQQLQVVGDKIYLSGRRYNPDSDEYTDIPSRAALRSMSTPTAKKNENGEFELPSYSYTLNGTFEDWINVDARVRSELTIQSGTDGGSNTKYEAQSGYYVNLIVGNGSSQSNPVMPDFSDDATGTYKFNSGVSGAWFDPIIFESYLFSMDSVDSYFTDIFNFPTGFGDTFGLYGFDGENNLYDFASEFDFTESVSFESLLAGIDITSFLVTGIEDASDNHQFPIQLGFSTSTADFTMQGIEDAEAFLASFRNQQDPTNKVSEPATLGAFMLGIGLLLFRSRKAST
jgi:hypothetical protein